MAIGMAQLESQPFTKIPGIYELYVLFDFFAFGIGSRAQKLKEKNRSGSSVSFKI